MTRARLPPAPAGPGSLPVADGGLPALSALPAAAAAKEGRVRTLSGDVLFSKEPALEPPTQQL